VSVGVVVERDTVIGIVEAMKLMNRITADQSGVVRDVLVADGRAVEFEQPLLVLDPVPEHGWRNG
jgi:acetyl-CoA carboxylase biotin carboxyl carrier protein